MATEGILFIVFSNLGIRTQVLQTQKAWFLSKKRMRTKVSKHEDGWEELRVKPNTAASQENAVFLLRPLLTVLTGL